MGLVSLVRIQPRDAVDLDNRNPRLQIRNLSPVKRKLIKKIAYSYYEFFGELDVAYIAKKRQIKIDWILEAGCHDGSDSVELFKNFNPNRYLAFEPDETARVKASRLFSEKKLEKIELFPLGLSSNDERKFLKYEAEGKGSGSTHFSASGEDAVNVISFDEHFQVQENSGLLWLDVEGHALQALTGMTKSLHKIAIARVEVQLHKRDGDFPQDFIEIVELMKQVSLIPIFGPVYPGYFGDIIFVNRNLINIRDKARSKLLILQMNFLHLFLYPRINKPTPT